MPDKPKSSFELAMERLAAADKEAGVSESPLTDEQREAIGEARRVAVARLAEREILFRDAMKRVYEPADREKAQQEYQTDRRRIEETRDREVERVRSKRPL